MGQSNIRARLLDYAAVSVAINGAGAGETVVVQNEADEAAGAVYRVKSGTDTKDGFTLEVTGSSRISRTISVKYVAHEKD
jgi:hypothetical protein